MTETTSEYVAPAQPAIWRRISWPAVFAGTFVALAMKLLFSAFGLFIGFTLSSPGGTDTWAKIWYFVTAFVALFTGAWVAARLSTNTSGSGRIHGAVTWGLTTMATFTFTAWLFSGVLTTWITALRTPALTTNTAAATAQASSALNAGEASTLFLVIFGGILCGCVASLIGGAMGSGERFPFVPVRLRMPEHGGVPSPHSGTA